MTSARLATLVRKEWLDLSRNRLALVPVATITVLAIVLPFLIAIGVPALTGERLSDDRDLITVSRMVGAGDALSDEGRVQLFLFEQFLTLFLLIPITGAMALASHAVVGEKQARTLEPLLATPITTVELLVAKVIGALVPTLLIALAGIVADFGAIAVLAEPGVFRAMINPRTAVLVAVVSPTIALVALQAALLVSSRVNDARTAQQFGVLIIVPISIVLVAQFMGRMWLSASTLAFVGLGAFGVWILLTLVSAAVFEREAILTRWR
jgi:ABC-2 type transport system permease protein